MILKQRSAFNSKEQKSDEFSRWQFLVDVSKTNSASAAFNYDSGQPFFFLINHNPEIKGTGIFSAIQ